ncbi:ThuA domain-containing protein [Streptomyces avicenniae]|uniref:ThuA domain-containing protein n=1 Tax=Streptomyces avicenniae TaxID=500153 RepID=UPI00069B9FF2|nr:ThuA domain-containing protein [Streptomyces avicenniae]
MSAPHIVVYSRTTGFRHDSIPAGVTAFAELAAEHGIDVTATEDPDVLTARLPGSAAVVFLSTSGAVLTDAGRDALRTHLADGGGFVGVHAASTTEYDWPWFGGELVGAVFDGHPPIQEGTVVVEDRDHPATAHLDGRWDVTDEWYNFTANPRARVRVLASADESTYEGGTMGADHPLVWCHETGGGRSFYTALGHRAESYAEPVFRRHLLGGLLWAARIEG